MVLMGVCGTGKGVNNVVYLPLYPPVVVKQRMVQRGIRGIGIGRVSACCEKWGGMEERMEWGSLVTRGRATTTAHTRRWRVVAFLQVLIKTRNGTPERPCARIPLTHARHTHTHSLTHQT